MKFNKKALTYAAGLLSGIGALAVGGSFAVDSAVPYTFEDGQVISADVMNDLFSKIKNTTSGFESAAELTGTWSCTQYQAGSPTFSVSAGAPNSAFSQISNSNVWSGSSTWTFSNSGNSLSVTNFIPIAANEALNNTVTCYAARADLQFDVLLAEGYLLLSGKNLAGGCTTPGLSVTITKISPYKFKYPVQNGFGVCVSQTQPPAIPSGLTLSGATLSWTDNSSDETAFVVMKKSAGGSWTALATVSANTTTYTDSSPASGDKYRVKARNANGDSLGSNVVRTQ